MNSIDWSKFREQVLDDCKAKRRLKQRNRDRSSIEIYKGMGYKGHVVLIAAQVDGFLETVRVLNVTEFDAAGKPKTYRIRGAYSDSPEFVDHAEIRGLA